jgi:3-oxoacyl-[acyl-carrier-protein] synthase II
MYITGIGNISPQQSFDNQSFLENPRFFERNRLSCMEPEYKNFIGPVQIRRMGRIVKMGISAAKIAMHNANVPMPDAIIVGTGLGCLEDTEKFLRVMLDDNEQTAAPTPFISSTHNSVAGAIALQIKCLGYNYTYVHKGFSFISCLYDAALQMQLADAQHVLVGGIDEMTDTKYHNNQLIEIWNNDTPDTGSVFSSDSDGILAGEGSTFFMLSKEKTENSYARIIGFKQVFSEAEEDVNEAFQNILIEHGLRGESFVLLEGRSGSRKEDKFYGGVEKIAGEKAVRCVYKHLSGSYYTSDSFGLWVAANILKSGTIPSALQPSSSYTQKPKFVVLYDHVSFGEHVFQILSA